MKTNHFSLWNSCESAIRKEPSQIVSIEDVLKLLQSHDLRDENLENLPVICPSGEFKSLDANEFISDSGYFGFTLSLPDSTALELEKLKISLAGDKKLSLCLAFCNPELELVNGLIKQWHSYPDNFYLYADYLKTYLSNHFPDVKIAGYPSSITNLLTLCHDPNVFFCDRLGTLDDNIYY